MKTFHNLRTCLQKLPPGSQPRAAFAALLTLASLLVPQPSGAADLYLSSRTATDLDAPATAALDTIERRRFVQSLELRLQNLIEVEDRELLSLVASARLETDFARPVQRNSQDPRVAEPVDIVLQRAYLDARPTSWLQLRAGRQFLWGALTPADIDGAHVQVGEAALVYGRVAAGREVRRDVLGLDDDAFDVTGGRQQTLGDDRPETTALVQLAIGSRRRRGGVEAGFRQRWRHGDVVGQQAAVSGTVDLTALRVRLDGDLNLLMGPSPDRLHGQATVPLTQRGSVWLAWQYWRPSFDGDSIFNVFGVTPQVEWRLGGQIRELGPVALTVEGRLSGFETGERIPWSGGLGPVEQRAGGAAAHLRANPIAPLVLRASVGAEGGYGGPLIHEELATTWEFRSQVARVGLRLRHAYRESDQRATHFGHLLAARAEGRYNLGSFGRLKSWLEYVNDYRTGQSLRVLLLAEFDIGPY